jgi:N-acetylglucosamine-6-sulfatase
VPLIVDRPHVRAGARTSAMSENVDLAKMFEAIAGTHSLSDGHSLLPLLDGTRRSGWRNAIRVEHRGPVRNLYDPDRQGPASGNPTSCAAVRTNSFLYVRYAGGEREYHALATDRYELDNQADQLSGAQVGLLDQILTKLVNCHGGQSCWAAAHIPPGTVKLLSQPGEPTVAPARRHPRHSRGG